MSATSAGAPPARAVAASAAARSRVSGARHVHRRVEELADRPPLGDRLLPQREAQDAVGAAGRVAVVLHGHGDGGERRLGAEQAQGLGERRRVQVAGGDLHGGAGRQAPQHLVRGALAHHARAERAHPVEVVGEAGRRRLGGHERVPGGEVRLHRRGDGAAAHDRPAEDHRLAAGRRGGDPRPRDLRRRGHDQLDRVLERLAGTREEDVAGAGAHVDREDAGGLCCGGHGGRGSARRGPQAVRRVGTWLKRSFQTFFIASTTMSLLILLSPTLRSTKMMGSSTTLNPSL